MTRNCKRCAVAFVVTEVAQERCFQCAREVAELIAKDTERRTRFANSKALEGWRPSAA